MKDIFGSILSVIVFIVFIVACTYAWFSWKVDRNDRVGVNFAINDLIDDCITYSFEQKGSKKIISTHEMKMGYITSLDVAQSCDDELYVAFKLKLKKIPKELKNKKFKYALLENDKIVVEGNFLDKKQGETLMLVDKQLINNLFRTYQFILWYDDDNVDVSNLIYDFDLMLDVSEKD